MPGLLSPTISGWQGRHIGGREELEGDTQLGGEERRGRGNDPSHPTPKLPLVHIKV
jgi:hypothetical protein